MALAVLATLPPGGAGSLRLSEQIGLGLLRLLGVRETSVDLALLALLQSGTWRGGYNPEGNVPGNREGVATGRECLLASQPGCFQSGSHSLGFSLSALPSPLNRARGRGSWAAVVAAAVQVWRVSLGSGRGLCKVATVAYL